VLEPADTATTQVSNQSCPANPQLFASLERRD